MTKRTLLQLLTSVRPLSHLGKTSSNRGAYAESEAREYLQKHGLSFICANYFCKGGEIDLVMSDKNCVVFVEVRHRASHRYGSAAESVDNRKQKKLRHAAEHYLQQHPHSGSCRFDVIAMTGPVTQDNIDWIKNAF
jgi:putative endonuclease